MDETFDYLTPVQVQALPTFVIEAVKWSGDNYEGIFKHYNPRNKETGEIDNPIWMSCINTFDALDVANSDGKIIRVRVGNWLGRFESGWFFEIENDVMMKHFVTSDSVDPDGLD